MPAAANPRHEYDPAASRIWHRHVRRAHGGECIRGQALCGPASGTHRHAHRCYAVSRMEWKWSSCCGAGARELLAALERGEIPGRAGARNRCPEGKRQGLDVVAVSLLDDQQQIRLDAIGLILANLKARHVD